MKKTNIFKILIALTVILTLFTSCSFVPVKDTDTENTETAASTEDAITTSAPATEAESSTETETEPASEENTSEAITPVDVEALEKIAAEDTFPVKIIKTEVINDFFAGDNSVEDKYVKSRFVNRREKDAVAFTVQNNSSKTIDSISIDLKVFFKDTAVPTELNGFMTGTFVANNPDTLAGIRTVSYNFGNWKDLNIAPGETVVLYISFDRENSDLGVVGIVSKYTTSDGTEETNPIATTWISNLP